jgi:hypothetical protein
MTDADFNLKVLWVDDDSFMINVFKQLVGSAGELETLVRGPSYSHVHLLIRIL